MVVVVPEGVGPFAPPGDGAFADFLDLRTAVIELVARPDIADVFPRIVALAESRLNRELRMREQITTETVTFTDGRGPLPEDFAEIIGIYDGNGCEYVQQSPQRAAAGGTAYYSVEGSEIVAPGLSGQVSVTYYATIPSLNDGLDTTNWLLARYPDIYLYSCGFEAAKYLRDADTAQATRPLMDDAIRTAKADDERARYSRARVRVQGVNP